MPLQLGRNPKSYPPNDNYRDNWDRMFRRGKKPVKASSGAELLAGLSKGVNTRGAKAFIPTDGKTPKMFEDIERQKP